MKRIVSVLIATMIVLGLTSCTVSSPTGTVTKYCESLKKLDAKAMGECTGKDIEPVDFNNFDNDYVKSIMTTVKSNAKKINYKIIDENVDGDNTYVTVEFEYVDLSVAFGEAVTNMLSNALALAFSGNTDEETLTKMFLDKFDEIIKNKELKMDKKKIVFTCSKSDSNWLITDVDTDGLIDIAMGGIMSSANRLSNAFS